MRQKCQRCVKTITTTAKHSIFFFCNRKKKRYLFFLLTLLLRRERLHAMKGWRRKEVTHHNNHGVCIFLGKRVVSADQTETRVTHLRVLGTSGSGEAQQ